MTVELQKLIANPVVKIPQWAKFATISALSLATADNKRQLSS